MAWPAHREPSLGRPLDRPAVQDRRNHYGYLWWIREYPYRGRTIKAYYLAGNGSQISMWIPELDLSIATFGGNYNSPSIHWVLQDLIPKQLLPAIFGR